MEGFLSTSLLFHRIHNFIGNLLIEVTVYKDDLGGELDNGFALISEFSTYADEKEVLFNAINMFKITEISWEKREIVIN